jgi:hypothetical protein
VGGDVDGGFAGRGDDGGERGSGSIEMLGRAGILGGTRILCDAGMFCDICTFDDTWLFGDTRILGDARISGNDTRTSGDTGISGGGTSVCARTPRAPDTFVASEIRARNFRSSNRLVVSHDTFMFIDIFTLVEFEAVFDNASCFEKFIMFPPWKFKKTKPRLQYLITNNSIKTKPCLQS